MKEDHFSGEITTEQGGYLLVTLPFDPGWKAYVDGEQVEIKTLDSALMAIHLEAGSHRIFFAFLPPGFHQGLYVSLSALCVLLIFAGGRLAVRIQRKKSAAGVPLEEAEGDGDPD